MKMIGHFGAPKMEENLSEAGAPHQTPLGELTALPISHYWWGEGCLPLPNSIPLSV